MSIDPSPIGRCAADLMDTWPEEEDGEIVAVGIVVVIDDGEGTYSRTQCSRIRRFEQEGLFREALRVVQEGN